MKVQIVLDLSKRSNAQLMVDADHYTISMTGNTNFAAADIVAEVTAAKAAVVDMRTAVNAVNSDTKTENVRLKRDIVERRLSRLASKVEDVANDPGVMDANRVNIVLSAGMIVKSQASRKKQVFTVVNASISGTVQLTAAGGANAHEWQYTTDTINLTNRVSADSSTTARTEIAGLTKGKEYAFFHKSIIAGEKTDWEGPVMLVII